MAIKKIILGAAGIVAAGAVINYFFIPPTFRVTMYQPSTHSGEYQFGRVRNNFGNSVATIGGRAGWDLEVTIDNEGFTIFNLLKDGKVVKRLDRR